MNGSPLAAYATTKGAVLMMTKTLACEWAKTGVTYSTYTTGQLIQVDGGWNTI